MTEQKLREAKNLEAQIFALERIQKIPPANERNPNIYIEGGETKYFIPKTLNHKIFELVRCELSKLKEEFEKL